MHRRIIVGYRDGERGDEAVALARSLAQGASGEALIVHVLEHAGSRINLPLAEKLRQDAEQALEPHTRGWPAGMRATARAVAGGSTARVLHELDGPGQGNLIVLGSTHRGPVGRVLAGTTAEQLLHGGACPVVIAPKGYFGYEGGVRTIGVAYDGSPQSEAALEWAVESARAFGAGLRLIAVVEPPPVQVVATWGVAPPAVDYPELLQTFRDRLGADVDRALAGLPDDVHAEATIAEGDPASELQIAAREGVDLLVLGSRGFGPVRTVLLGSVSARLVRSCRVPTVIVPRPAAAPEGPPDSSARRHSAGAAA